MSDLKCNLRTLIKTPLVVFAVLGASTAMCSSDPVLESIVEKSYPAGSATKLSIRNTDGSIRIYGADTNEIKIQAVKKAYVAKRLEQISVNITTEADTISIETKYPPKPKWGFSDRSGTVDYVIVIPEKCTISDLELSNGEVLLDGLRSRDVHARLGSGRMFGHNCFGELHLEVTDGAIDIEYDWWENGRCSIDANVINGNLRAFIPSDAGFHLVAKSINGGIGNDFASKKDRVPGGVQSIDTVVNDDGESNLRLHAVNGSIQITEVNL